MNLKPSMLTRPLLALFVFFAGLMKPATAQHHLLPPLSQEEIDLVWLATSGTLTNGPCALSGTSYPCYGLFLYREVFSTPIVFLIEEGPDNAYCSSGPIDGDLTLLVQSSAQGRFLEALYLGMYDPGNLAQPVFVLPLRTIDACCLTPFHIGLNAGFLNGSGSTSPGSTVTFRIDNPQSPQAASTMFVATSSVSPTNVGFGFLHLNPASVIASLPTGLQGAGDFSVTLPNDPALSGETFYIQALLQDSMSVDPFRLTNGMVLAIP